MSFAVGDIVAPRTSSDYYVDINGNSLHINNDDPCTVVQADGSSHYRILFGNILCIFPDTNLHLLRPAGPPVYCGIK